MLNSLLEHWETAPRPLLTESLARPPVRLLHGVEHDLRVQQQPVKEVSGAALGLADDVEEGQAAQTEQPAVFVPLQVAAKVGPQLVAHGLEAAGAQREQVLPVGVSVWLPGELLIPAGALDAGQEMARNYRKQLRRWRDKMS